MKLPRDIIFYTLFGIVLLSVGVAGHNLYEINQAIKRLEHLKESNTHATTSNIYQYIRTYEVNQISEN